MIEANTNVTNLQTDVFLFKASIGGTVTANGSQSRCGNTSPARPVSGVTVELVDANGNILAKTVTNSQGNYNFNQQSGLSSTGVYTVKVVPPAGDTAASPATIAISRGEYDATANFSLNGGNSNGWSDPSDSGGPWSADPFDSPSDPFAPPGHRGGSTM